MNRIRKKHYLTFVPRVNDKKAIQKTTDLFSGNVRGNDRYRHEPHRELRAFAADQERHVRP